MQRDGASGVILSSIRARAAGDMFYFESKDVELSGRVEQLPNMRAEESAKGEVANPTAYSRRMR